MIGHPFFKFFKKQFYSQKRAYHAQIDALSLLKKDNENVRHFALKVETLQRLILNVMKFLPVVSLKN